MSAKKNVEAIFPLSPMQEGMLFHSLSDKDSGLYVEQSACTLAGDLDPAALRRAWEGVLSRHSVLRASFHWEEVERPVHIRVKALDERGNPILVEASGLEARVIQHEMDHLDGVLILDRTSRDQRKQAMRTLREQLEPRPAAA